MHKGFIQLGNLIFVVLFIVMIFAAGYLYFFSSQNKDSGVVVAANIDQKAQIHFVHPFYNYSLDLPYGWKNKYQVLESANQTDFVYVDESGRTDLLFSLKRQLATDLVALPGESKKLGVFGDFIYILIIPERLTEALSPTNSQMRREVLAVGDSFSLIDKNPSELIINNILSTDKNTTSSSTIRFSTFEIIATQENASTTEYYIWFNRRKFLWADDSRLRDWPVESLPALVSVNKNNITSIKIPRSGSNLKSDIAKIFPASVSGSSIFLESSPEHLAMLDKLSSRLNEAVVFYFGEEPVLTRAGFIENISFGTNSLELVASLAESVKLSASSTYFVSDINKSTRRFSISSTTPALSLPALVIKNKIGKIISSTTPQDVRLSDLPVIFGKTSTSTWRKKPFWFEIQNEKVLKILPL